MKQFLLASFFASLLAIAVQAQITITPEISTNIFEGVHPNATTDLPIHIAVTNNSSDTVQLKWLRKVNGDCPVGWKTQVCDNNLCYNFNVSSNINPAIGLDAPFILKPVETFDNFILHIWPGTSEGCCTIDIDFYDLKDTSVVAATAQFEVSVDMPNCFVGTEETSPLSLRVFPNPASEYFTVSDNPHVKNITVTNLLRKRVRSFSFQSGNSYDISDLPDGMYLVSMKDGKNNVLKTQRLSKRSARP